MRENEKSGKTRVASMRATDWANVWTTGRVSMRVARESQWNDWTDNHAKAQAGKWLKRE